MPAGQPKPCSLASTDTKLCKEDTTKDGQRSQKRGDKKGKQAIRLGRGRQSTRPVSLRALQGLKRCLCAARTDKQRFARMHAQL